LALCGTIPVPYKGNTYNIPVEINFFDGYPNTAPLAKVVPTENMLIKESEYVKANG